MRLSAWAATATSVVGSIAKCEAPTFAGVCTSETPLARTYRHLDLDQRRILFRLVEARTPVGEIAARLGRHPSTIYRELGRNRFRDGDRGFCGYFPLTAHDLARRRPPDRHLRPRDRVRRLSRARPRAGGGELPLRPAQPLAERKRREPERP